MAFFEGVVANSNFMQSDLTNWLWQLIGANDEAGAGAAKNLQRLYYELDALTEGGYAAQVRATLAAPDFGTRLFVEQLGDFLEAAQGRRMGLYRQDDAGTQKTRSQILKRQVQAGIVFSCLRDELLLAPEALRAWIGGDGDRKRRLNEALKQLGGAARQFTPDLLAALDRAEMYRFEFVGALASLARDDADTIRALIERVQLSPGKGAVNPLRVLRSIGPRVAEVAPDVFEVLLAALDAKESRNAAIRAMGTIGAGNATWGERIARRLLELSRTDDEWQKGAALWALGDLAMSPDVVVPRLIEAFDDYDEPDPDYCYGSAHTFVTRGLKAFGPLAVGAVERRIWRTRQRRVGRLGSHRPARGSGSRGNPRIAGARLGQNA